MIRAPKPTTHATWFKISKDKSGKASIVGRVKKTTVNATLSPGKLNVTHGKTALKKPLLSELTRIATVLPKGDTVEYDDDRGAVSWQRPGTIHGVYMGSKGFSKKAIGKAIKQNNANAKKLGWVKAGYVDSKGKRLKGYGATA